jgi:beta-galactosidase
VLRAVGRRDGVVVCTQEVRTTGAPAAIRLTTDRSSITANRRDIAHVTVEIVDAEGLVLPQADNLVEFDIQGQGRLIGVDNGNQADHDSYQAPRRRAFNGMALAIVQASDKAGKIQLDARSDELEGASIEITVVPAPTLDSL